MQLITMQSLCLPNFLWIKKNKDVQVQTLHCWTSSVQLNISCPDYFHYCLYCKSALLWMSRPNKTCQGGKTFFIQRCQIGQICVALSRLMDGFRIWVSLSWVGLEYIKIANDCNRNLSACNITSLMDRLLSARDCISNIWITLLCYCFWNSLYCLL